MPEPRWKTGEDKPVEYVCGPMELKTVEGGKDADGQDGGVIEGYAAVFNNVDWGLDKILPGAFSKTLKENSGVVPVLSNHDRWMQIGWGLSGTQDDHGLAVKGWLDTADNSKAREHYSLAKKAKKIGAKAGLSIGYRTIKAEPDPDNPSIRLLHELRLLEWSPVSFPMNDHAQITAAKAALATAMAERNGEGLNGLVKFFLVTMRGRGYPDGEVVKALTGAAETSQVEPGTIVHSLSEGFEDIKQFLDGLKIRAK